MALLERVAAEYQAAHEPALTALGITIDQIKTLSRQGCAYHHTQLAHRHSAKIGEQGVTHPISLTVSTASRQDVKESIPNVLVLIDPGCTLVQAEKKMESSAWCAGSRAGAAAKSSRQAACACR